MFRACLFGGIFLYVSVPRRFLPLSLAHHICNKQQNKMIPEKLQTGMTAIDSHEVGPEQYAFITKIMGLVLLLLKRAMILAGNVVKHRGGDTVGAEEVNQALMHEAMAFFDSETLEQDLEEMVAMLEEAIDEETDLSDADAIGDHSDALIENLLDDASRAMSDSNDSEGDGPRPPDDKECSCEMCAAVENVREAWDQWDVTDDPVKAFLKQHLDTIMAEELDM